MKGVTCRCSLHHQVYCQKFPIQPNYAHLSQRNRGIGILRILLVGKRTTPTGFSKARRHLPPAALVQVRAVTSLRCLVTGKMRCLTGRMPIPRMRRSWNSLAAAGKTQSQLRVVCFRGWVQLFVKQARLDIVIVLVLAVGVLGNRTIDLMIENLTD